LQCRTRLKHLLPHVQAEDHAVRQVLSCNAEEDARSYVPMCKRRIMQTSDKVCNTTKVNMSIKGF